MKRFALMSFAIVALLSPQLIAHDDVIGEERIKPLNFPKFSFSADYALSRKFHGLANKTYKLNLPNRFSGSLSFEANLYRYMNAGAMISMSFSELKKGEPLDYRLGLFAKPFFPFAENFALIGRVMGGLAAAIAIYPAFAYFRHFNPKGFDAIYRNQNYNGWPFGAFMSASVGLEVFFFSRLGLTVEGGVRASIFRNHQNIPFTDSKTRVVGGAPSAFNFLIYEWPIFATLQVIF